MKYVSLTALVLATALFRPVHAADGDSERVQQVIELLEARLDECRRMPALEVRAVGTTENHTIPALIGRTFELTIVSDGQRIRSHWYEKRPAGAESAQLSSSCSFDGQIIREDPEGRLANSPSASVAKEYSARTANPQPSLCMNFDYRLFGMAPVEFFGHPRLSDNESLTQSHYKKLCDALRDSSVWQVSITPDEKAKTRSILTAYRKLEEYEVWQGFLLNYSPETHEVHELAVISDPNVSRVRDGTARGRSSVHTEWQVLKCGIRYPKRVTLQQISGAEVRRRELVSFEVLREVTQLDSTEFSWKALGLPDGRAAIIPGYQEIVYWNGQSFEPSGPPVAVVAQSEAIAHRRYNLFSVLFFANVAVVIAALCWWRLKRRHRT